MFGLSWKLSHFDIKDEDNEDLKVSSQTAGLLV